MARERMVTRTIDEAMVEVMTLDVSTQKVDKMCYKVSATIGEEKTLTYIQKTYDTKTLKHVSIIGYTVKEVLYGMPEADFIKYAKILPPRTTDEQ